MRRTGLFCMAFGIWLVGITLPGATVNTPLVNRLAGALLALSAVVLYVALTMERER